MGSADGESTPGLMRGDVSRRSGGISLLALVALLAALFAAVPADAAPKRVASFFGSAGSGDGQFGTGSGGVGGLAVNRTGAGGVGAGDVYVVDRGNNRVQRFNAAGAYQAQFGATGTQGGQFSRPESVAVSQSDGSVYVLDGTNLRVQKFDAAGVFQWAVGKDVLVGGVTTTETCTVAANCKIGVTGTLGGEFAGSASTFVGQVAVDPSDGSVYVTDPVNRRVQQFTAAGAFVRVFGFDVLTSGPGNSGVAEVQAATVRATSGWFTLSFSSQTTAPLAATATAGQVQAALNALSTVGGVGGSVAVSGGPGDSAGSSPYVIAFGGALRGVNVAQVSAADAGLGAAVGTVLSCAAGPGSAASLVFGWLRDGTPVPGAAASTYTTVGADSGRAVQCRVTASSPDGATTKVGPAAPVSTVVAAPPANTTAPALSGTVAVGSVLTCGDGVWTGSPTLSRQWLRNSVPIPFETGPTYTPVGGDLNAAIQCEVTAVNAGGTVLAGSGPVTVLPVPPANSASGLPTISGTLAVGSTLTCNNGTWTASPAFTYRWTRSGVAIAGATANTYLLDAADAGKAVQCEVTGTNADGAAVAMSANSVIPPAPSPAPPAKAASTAVINGTVAVGSTLTCAHATWQPTGTPITFTYVWLRNGVAIPGSESGPTTNDATYTLTAADFDKLVQCRVVATTPTGASVAVSTGAQSRLVGPVIPTATSALAGGATVATATTTAGAPALEACAVAASCKVAATQGSEPGRFSNNQPTRLTVDPSSGDVYAVESSGSFRVQRFANAGGGLTASVFADAVVTGANAGTAPTDVAIDADNGNVLVAKAYPAAFTAVCPTGSPSIVERRVLELTTAESLVSTSMDCAGVTPVNGIAATDGRLYASSTTGGQRVFALDSQGAAPPVAAIEPATTVGAHSATLNGTIDASGTQFTAGYHFEYRKDAPGTEWSRVPASDTPAGAPGAVSQTIPSGLEASHDYLARLVVNRQHNSASTTTDETEFTTLAEPVTAVTTIRPTPVGDAFAYLRGTLDPNNNATDWHFEYVTDTQFQADEQALGASHGFDNAQATPTRTTTGAGTKTIVERVEGLDPDTQYKVRLVADNGIEHTPGDTTVEATPQDLTTRTPGASNIPDRGYELVSGDTNGLAARPGVTSPAGDNFAYSTFLAAPGTEGGATGRYWTERQPDGSWVQRSVGPPAPPVGLPVGIATAPLFSGNDLSLAAFGTAIGIDADDPGFGNFDAYRMNLRTGAFRWVSRDPAIPVGTPQTAPEDADGVQHISADGGRVVFASVRNLLPEDTSTGIGNPQLYQWDDGELSLVSVAPGASTSLPLGSGIGSLNNQGAGTDAAESSVVSDAVSRDGSRVFFESGPFGTANVDKQRLFVRVDGQSTVEASASQGMSPAVTEPTDVNYWGADAVGESAFFTSTSQLTPDSSAVNGSGLFSPGDSADLYRYNVPADGDPANGELVDLFPHPGGADVVRVLDVSDDGRRVYFLANAVLTPGATAGDCHGDRSRLLGSCNLYLAELEGSDDDSAQLTLVTSGRIRVNSNPWSAAGAQGAEFARQVAASADGSVLAFRAYDDLVQGQRADSHLQVYVYEAARDELSCASCPSDGSPAQVSASLTPAQGVGSEGLSSSAEPPPGATPSADSTPGSGGTALNLNRAHDRNVSSDGAVFFQTAEGLVSDDVDGLIDTYEWRGGSLALVSDSVGEFAANAGFAGASVDGSTVFFFSGAEFVPGVEAGSVRVYAARVGGGYRPPPSRSCASEDCRAPATRQPEQPLPGTGTLVGRGDPDAGARRALALRSPSLAQRRRAARSGVVAVGVRIGRPGVVRLSAVARVSGRTRQVGRVTRRLSKAGVATVRLRLSGAARQRLRSGQALRLVIVARAADARPRSVTVTLRGPRS